MREPGIRPGFWITIAGAVVVLALVLRGYWEWGAVGLIALFALGRLPNVRWR